MLSSLLKYHNVRQSLEEFLKTNNYDKLSELINSLDSKELGIVIQKLSSEKLQHLVNIFPHFIKYKLFRNFSSDLQNDLFNAISNENLQKVLSKLSYDELFSIYTCLSHENQKRMLSLIMLKDVGAIHIKKKYIDFEIGDIISLNYLVIPLFWTVRKAKELIAKDSRYYSCNYKVLIANEKLEIIGYVVISELLVAKDDSTLNTIVDYNIANVNIENCGVANLVQKISYNNLDFVVILDSKNKLIGTVSAVDVLTKAQRSLLRHNDNVETLTFIENSVKYFPMNLLACVSACIVCFVYFFTNKVDNWSLLPFIAIVPLSFAYTGDIILNNLKASEFSLEALVRPLGSVCVNALIISIIVLGVVTSIEGVSKGILTSLSTFCNVILSFTLVIVAKFFNIRNSGIHFNWTLMMPIILSINLLSLVLICVLH